MACNASPTTTIRFETGEEDACSHFQMANGSRSCKSVPHTVDTGVASTSCGTGACQSPIKSLACCQ
eukprot:scaffold360_cov192-Amphora_coffeaeformis.AAC.13